MGEPVRYLMAPDDATATLWYQLGAVFVVWTWPLWLGALGRPSRIAHPAVALTLSLS